MTRATVRTTITRVTLLAALFLASLIHTPVFAGGACGSGSTTGCPMSIVTAE